MSQKIFVHKYKTVLVELRKLIEDSKPGDRLPTVRAMMDEYQVSQAAIERCLDQLERDGHIRRDRGSGIFIEGSKPRSTVIGVYTDGESSYHAHSLFMQGVRDAAARQGFHVADFGPKNMYDSQEEILATMNEMGFAGIITALSSMGLFNIESDRQLAKAFKEIRIPLVTCRPFPAVMADTVMPDYFSAFQSLGAYLRDHVIGPIKFIAHQGLFSLSRLHGLRAGLLPRQDLEPELVDGSRTSAYERARQLNLEKWRGTLVIGVPPREPGLVTILENFHCTEGEGQELAVVLESTQQLPVSLCAHVVIRPSYRMGEVATDVLIRRIRGFRGEMIHEIVPHQILYHNKLALVGMEQGDPSAE